MEIKIDSRPWAEDHSSPRSPLQVLDERQCPNVRRSSFAVQTPVLTCQALADVRVGFQKDHSQADFTGGIDVRIETTSTSIGGSCCY